MLIDSLLQDLPVPTLLLQRALVAASGRTGYAVVDGQQRLRAVFDFQDGKFRLTRSGEDDWRNKRFDDLKAAYQRALGAYQFVVVELEDYSYEDIVEIFERMNKYAVKLSPQELRHARGTGSFHRHVEAIGRWDWWRKHKVFSPKLLRRMRAVEFAAELTILLLEGPQDKKKVIDSYYAKYQTAFPDRREVERRLRRYLNWIERTIPDIKSRRFRKPVDLYALIGAIDSLVEEGRPLSSLRRSRARRRLDEFERQLHSGNREGRRYLEAASRQTDNIGPRNVRIEVLSRLIA